MVSVLSSVPYRLEVSACVPDAVAVDSHIVVAELVIMAPKQYSKAIVGFETRTLSKLSRVKSPCSNVTVLVPFGST